MKRKYISAKLPNGKMHKVVVQNPATIGFPFLKSYAKATRSKTLNQSVNFITDRFLELRESQYDAGLEAGKSIGYSKGKREGVQSQYQETLDLKLKLYKEIKNLKKEKGVILFLAIVEAFFLVYLTMV